jgi:hypothetical protein
VPDLRADGHVQVPRGGEREGQRVLGDRPVVQRAAAGDHHPVGAGGSCIGLGQARADEVDEGRGPRRAAVLEDVRPVALHGAHRGLAKLLNREQGWIRVAPAQVDDP